MEKTSPFNPLSSMIGPQPSMLPVTPKTWKIEATGMMQLAVLPDVLRSSPGL